MVEKIEIAKNCIRQELDVVLKVAAQQHHDDDKLSDDANQAICNVIEAVFVHGLKDAFFLKGSRYSKYPEPNFWPFVSKFTHRSIKNQINDLKQIKSEIGKARAWIRIVLNEGQLEHYINILSKDIKQLENFYIKNAFLRDGERLEALMGYLKALAKLPITAPTNSTFLNAWTPTPLILAGLITGEPQRVTYIPNAKRRNASLNDLLIEEPAEEAINALELLNEPNTSEHQYIKKYYDDEDDASSIYSHPSMIEPNLSTGIPSNLKPTYSPFLSSTPENKPLFSLPFEEESTEVVVNRRRTIRVRKISRGSNSDDSRRGSLSHIGPDIVPMSSSLPTSSGLLPMVEMEKVLLKEKSVPEFGKYNKNYKSKEFLNEKDDKLREKSLFLAGDSIDENPEVFTTESNSATTLPINIVNSQYDQSANHEMSLHDEILASERYNLTSPSTTNQESSLSSSHGCIGNSLATKGWSSSSRKDSFGSSISSHDNSVSFDQELRVVLEKHDQQLNDGDITLENEKIIENVEEEEILMEKSEEMEEIEFKKVEDNKDGPVIIEEDSLIATDVYGISRNILTLFTEIAIEKGLDGQNYRCLSCRKSIGGPFGKFNLCNLDAKYYCDDCFKKGDESIIPARVILNWDCRKRPISKASKSFLRTNGDRPIIRIDKVNPKLYQHSKLMTKILKLREKLSLVAVYLLSCKQSVAEDLKRRIWPQDYFYTDIHLYSFTDIQNVLSGVLEKRLNTLIKFAITHIESCHLCLQKGFICEFCSAKKIIYPFQVDISERCTTCGAVYHIKCFKNKDCPRCIRRNKYAARRADLPLE